VLVLDVVAVSYFYCPEKHGERKQIELRERQKRQSVNLERSSAHQN